MTLLDSIGNTPLIEVEKDIFAKCEFTNPGGSVKDRIALEMVQEALKEGKVERIVEPTSGNTGIALAMIGSYLGIKVTIVMPESMSIERRKLMSFLGAEVVLTPANEGMKGAVTKAKELVKEGGVLLDQFSNLANVRAHLKTTAPEILKEIVPDIFVTGVGTGGTISGVGKMLKLFGTYIFLEPISSLLSLKKARY